MNYSFGELHCFGVVNSNSLCFHVTFSVKRFLGFQSHMLVHYVVDLMILCTRIRKRSNLSIKQVSKEDHIIIDKDSQFRFELEMVKENTHMK